MGYSFGSGKVVDGEDDTQVLPTSKSTINHNSNIPFHFFLKKNFSSSPEQIIKKGPFNLLLWMQPTIINKWM